MSEILSLFVQTGFQARVLRADAFERLPTPRQPMSREFAEWAGSELLVTGFDVVLRPA